MNWVAPDNPICPFIVRENPEFGPLGEGGGFLELIMKTRTIYAAC
jgi:hypothetical protein